MELFGGLAFIAVIASALAFGAWADRHPAAPGDAEVEREWMDAIK